MRFSNKHLSFFFVIGAASLSACATATPRELTEAREAYSRAMSSPAPTLAPAQLDTAKKALTRAELSYKDEPKSIETRDYSYLAERESELAIAAAGIEAAKRQKAGADREIELAKARETQKMREELSQTKTQLQQTEAERAMQSQQRNTANEQLSKTEAQLEAEKRARALAEEESKQAGMDKVQAQAETKAALDQLAKIGEVKEDARGTIITLNGSVLFASGQAVLLPAAQQKLQQLNTAIAGRKEMMTIAGHTDSAGSDSMNQALSLRRAQAVRDYLIMQGLPADRIQAVGLGESTPITDNATAEGRANNRRVEIILNRPTS